MYKVTFRKKNYRYRGPVESGKMNDNIIEVYNSLLNIYNAITLIKNDMHKLNKDMKEKISDMHAVQNYNEEMEGLK